MLNNITLHRIKIRKDLIKFNTTSILTTTEQQFEQYGRTTSMHSVTKEMNQTVTTVVTHREKSSTRTWRDRDRPQIQKAGSL